MRVTMSSRLDRDEPGASTDDLIQRLFAIVKEHPEQTAIIDTDGTHVSYEQLWASAGHFADRLPIVEGEIVGIQMARGTAVVVAMLAVLRAGGVYCPLSPDDPPQRTASLRNRIGMRFMLIEGVDDEIEIVDAGGPGRVLNIGSGLDRPIFVMWTSGSTGDPKAAVIAHRGVVRLIRDWSFMGLQADDRVAFAANPMFDVATWEVWATLGNSGTIVVIDSMDLVDAERLKHRFDQEAVSRAFLTTSLFDTLATRDPAMFGGLRSLAVGGEPLRPHTIGAVLRSGSPPGELLNGYGPSECTTFATSHRITLTDLEGVRIPLGRAVLDTHLVVVGDDGRAVEPGEDGELWVAGDGVGLGYLGPNGVEQDHFVEATFSDGVHRRWYRSGDLARITTAGLIDCLGRMDRQVKIRGYRVEPVEIERHLANCEGVAEAAVVTDRSRRTPQLFAFVVLHPATKSTPTSIRLKLQAELPAYMIPKRIIAVDELPVTANGKLDPAPLLELTYDESVTESIASSSLDPVLESVLNGARSVLGDSTIGPEDDLWEAGLDSLAVVELIEVLASSIGTELRAIDFVENPTPTQLASISETSQPDSASNVVVFNSSSTEDPLFIALGGGTSALGFRHMASIPAGRTRPIVVIEPEGLRSHRRSDQQIDSLAARIVSEIERRQPDGPLIVAGWSAGGAIATHAAWILEQRGRDVRLILLDTLFFVKRGGLIRFSYFRTVVSHLWRRIRAGVVTSWQRLRRSPAIERFLGNARVAEVQNERISDQARMFWIQLRSLRAYGAPPPIEAKVAHFHVRDSLAGSVIPLLLPGSEAFEVPGDHNTMFDATNVPVLVPLMNSWLDRTDPTNISSHHT